jgi:hypothetical protein
MKIYFSTKEEFTCTDICTFRTGGVFIGSVRCQECEYCFGKDLIHDWIDCKHPNTKKQSKDKKRKQQG